MKEFKKLYNKDAKPNTWYVARLDNNKLQYIFNSKLYDNNEIKYVRYENESLSKSHEYTRENCFYVEGYNAYECRLATNVEIQLLIDNNLNLGVTLTDNYEIY